MPYYAWLTSDSQLSISSKAFLKRVWYIWICLSLHEVLLNGDDKWPVYYLLCTQFILEKFEKRPVSATARDTCILAIYQTLWKWLILVYNCLTANFIPDQTAHSVRVICAPIYRSKRSICSTDAWNPNVQSVNKVHLMHQVKVISNGLIKEKYVQVIFVSVNNLVTIW